MVQSPLQNLTLHEFLALPETDTAHELVDGAAIPKMAPQRYQSRTQKALLFILENWGGRSPEESKALVQQWIDAANGQIVITPDERDRYGRMVAEVFTMGAEETFFQQELLMAGLAYVYPQYVNDCINGDAMKDAEAIAQEQQVGVWADPAGVKPWEWRRL